MLRIQQVRLKNEMPRQGDKNRQGQLPPRAAVNTSGQQLLPGVAVNKMTLLVVFKIVCDNPTKGSYEDNKDNIVQILHYFSIPLGNLVTSFS